MKKIIAILLFLLYGNSLQSQIINFEWAKQIGSNSYEYGMSLKLDEAGNVYSIGIFDGTVDFDPGPGVYNLSSTGSTDIYISKVDPAGNFIWAKHIGGSAQDIPKALELDALGNIYLTGYFSGVSDFDPGPAVFNLTSNSGYFYESSYLCKLDRDGNFRWATIVAHSSYATGTSLKIDPSGNVYATGHFHSKADFDPGPVLLELFGYPSNYVVKYDVNGNFIWVKQIQTPVWSPEFSNSWGFSLALDAAGDVYITGTFNYTSDFDPGPGEYIITIPPGGGHRIYILKLDKHGNFVWVKTIGGSATEKMVYSMVIDGFGNLYLTGYFSNTIDFDPGTPIYNLTAVGQADIYLLKLDPSGNFIWVKQFGSTDEVNTYYPFGHHSIALDNLGAIYTTGVFTGVGDFDPGPNILPLTSSGGTDIYICKLDINGDLVWAKSIGGNWYDYSLSIDIDNSKNIYTTGAFHTTVDFDPGSGTYTLSSVGSTDSYLLKLSQCVGNSNSSIIASVCNNYVLNGQTYTSSGIYTQIIPNAEGCDSIITLNLTINRKFTSVNATICEGQSYYAGGANQTTSGIYKDTLLTSLGCDSVVTTTLLVNSKPKPDLGPDGNLCTNAQASITPGSFSSYLWHDNSTQTNYIVTGPGTYWVTVTGANNCSATDTLNILSIDTIPKNFLPESRELCYGNVLKITIPNYSTYQWNTGSTNNYIDITNFDTYYLTVKDFNNCTGTDSITIQRKNCIYIAIPNAFTPNGDTKNDIFKPIINQAIQNYSFIIFNRYGQKIFETREYGKGWDGTFKGKDQPSGSYVYRIKFTNIFGWESVENGSVLLIR